MPSQNNTARVPEATNGRERTVVIDDAPISIQRLQQIYKELTGKSESISKSYDIPIHLTFTDLENLHYKINQALEQYHVTAANESFTIFYSENVKEQFSSFERLKLHNAGASESVDSILCKYELLIVPPALSKPQTYQISVRISSRLAVLRLMRAGDITKMLRIVGQRVISVEVTYVDYAIARTLLNIVDEWVKTIPKGSENKIVKQIQSHSHWIPRLVRLFTILIAGYASDDAINYFMRADDQSMQMLCFLILYSGLGIYVVYQIMGWLALFAEEAIDSWADLSYIKLNRADEIAIGKNEAANRKAVGKTIFGIAASVLGGITTKAISFMVFEHLLRH